MEACRGTCREMKFGPCYLHWKCTWHQEKIVGIQWTLFCLVLGIVLILGVSIFVGVWIFLCHREAQQRRREVAEAVPTIASRNLMERERAEEVIGQ